MFRFHVLAVLVPLLALAATARAADELPMEAVTVVGTRLDTSVAQQSGQLSIIDAQQIAALNKDSVEQLLEALPGVSINRQGGAGGVTSLYVRGGEANFTVVMIDGVQVNNPTNTRGGSFDFSTIDISMIERIELIRGPQSAVYGADALSGAVNLVTRSGRSGGEVTVRAEVGSDDYYRGTVYAGGDFGGNGGYGLTMGRTDSGDVVEDSKHDINFFNANVHYAFSDAWRGRAVLRYSESDRSSFPEDSGGPDFAVWRDLDKANSDDLSMLLAIETDISELWTSSVTASWFSLDSSDNTPGIAPGFNAPPRGADIDFDRYQLNWTNQLNWAATRLSFGAEIEREEGDSEGFIDFGFIIPADFDLKRDTTGVFVEAQHQLTDALSFSVGVRHDDPDNIDSETTSRVGAMYQFSSTGTILRANWGEGFKAPSFFALAYPISGNPDLDSETATSWDVGIEQQFGEDLMINLAWFDVDYKDLIDFDDETFTNINRDKVESSGAELTFRYALGDAGRIQGHATYQDLNIPGSDDVLRGRPDWKAGVQLFYRLSDTFSVSSEYLWVDNVYESSQHTGDPLDYKLDDYSTVDVNLAWQASRALKMELSVSNLFDENYEQAVGFPSAGIFPRLAVQYTF